MEKTIKLPYEEYKRMETSLLEMGKLLVDIKEKGHKIVRTTPYYKDYAPHYYFNSHDYTLLTGSEVTDLFLNKIKNLEDDNKRLKDENTHLKSTQKYIRSKKLYELPWYKRLI